MDNIKMMDAGIVHAAQIRVLLWLLEKNGFEQRLF